MIKKYKLFLESNNDIDAICKKFGIKNYTINPDGTVDVNGNVDLSGNMIIYFRFERLKKLPLKFGKVTGGFYCHNNQLATLEGAPDRVSGDFDCSDNQLTSLEGGPTEVGGHFYCNRNQLTTLEGSPKEVNGYFDCSDNQLITLEGSPREVGGDFYCHRNQLMDFRGFPEFFENVISLYDNPIEEIYYLFKNIKCIYWINEFDVIDGDKVIEDRLIEVYNQLGMEPPKSIELKNYTLV